MIWTTSVPGHPNCLGNTHVYPELNFTNWTVPFDDEWIQKRILTVFCSRYNWDKMFHQNMIALDVFRESGINFAVMDIYCVKILRPDGTRLYEKNGLPS